MMLEYLISICHFVNLSGFACMQFLSNQSIAILVMFTRCDLISLIFFSLFQMSFRNMLNRIGPSIDPWSTLW